MLPCQPLPGTHRPVIRCSRCCINIAIDCRQPRARTVLPGAGRELIPGPLPASGIDEFQCRLLSRRECNLQAHAGPLTAARIEPAPCGFSMQGLLQSGIPLDRDRMPAPAIRVSLRISPASRFLVGCRQAKNKITTGRNRLAKEDRCDELPVAFQRITCGRYATNRRRTAG